MEKNIGFTSIRQQPYDDLDIKIQSMTVDRCTHIVYKSNELIKQKQSKTCKSTPNSFFIKKNRPAYVWNSCHWTLSN